MVNLLTEKKWPLGSCMYQAEKLTREMLSRGIHDFFVIEGFVNIGGRIFTHTWIVRNGQVIDPTKNQFSVWGDIKKLVYLLEGRKYKPEEYLKRCKEHPVDFYGDSISESAIDFPRMELDPLVWNSFISGYFIKPSVKEKIYATLSKIPTDGVVKCDIIHVIGSICTNQYKEDADVDVHIHPVEEKYKTEDLQKKITVWMDANRATIDAFIGKHPIEIYLQLNPSQDMLADGCYDLLKDKWIKGPKITQLNYDPYEDYSDILLDVKQIASEMDVTLGEIKRDVIDFDTIKDALQNLPEDKRKHLYTALERKRNEIELEIQKAYKQRRRYIQARHESSQPITVGQAKNDLDMAKRWRDANAVHKFMNRYHYTRLVGELGKLIKDDSTISDKEVETIKGLL